MGDWWQWVGEEGESSEQLYFVSYIGNLYKILVEKREAYGFLKS